MYYQHQKVIKNVIKMKIHEYDIRWANEEHDGKIDMHTQLRWNELNDFLFNTKIKGRFFQLSDSSFDKIKLWNTINHNVVILELLPMSMSISNTVVNFF